MFHHRVWLLRSPIHLEADGDGKVKRSRVDQAGRGWDRACDLLGREGMQEKVIQSEERSAVQQSQRGGQVVSGLHHRP